MGRLVRFASAQSSAQLLRFVLWCFGICLNLGSPFVCGRGPTRSPRVSLVVDYSLPVSATWLPGDAGGSFDPSVVPRTFGFLFNSLSVLLCALLFACCFCDSSQVGAFQRGVVWRRCRVWSKCVCTQLSYSGHGRLTTSRLRLTILR